MFTNNFVEFLQLHNISAYQVAKGTGISQGTMNEYKNGKKLPTIQNLVKISNYLNCSTDYLLGRTDNINSHKEHSKNTVTGSYNVVDVDNSNVAVNVSSLDEHQKLLIDLYNQLSPIEQINLIADLSKANEKTATGKP